jgi:hypothetical protein
LLLPQQYFAAVMVSRQATSTQISGSEGMLASRKKSTVDYM